MVVQTMMTPRKERKNRITCDMWISVDNSHSSNNNCNKLSSNCDVQRLQAIGWSNISFIEPYWVVLPVSISLYRFLRLFFFRQAKMAKTWQCICFNSNKKAKYAHSNVVFNSSSYSHIWIAQVERVEEKTAKHKHTNTYEVWKLEVQCKRNRRSEKQPKRK